MQLLNVSYHAGSETWLHPFSLTLAEGAFNVVLGATRAGKTTLLRILAGLERPSSGTLLCGQQDVTGVPVRRRSVSMVYQQFINYPSLTAFENIASPLRVAGLRSEQIRAEVTALAELLQLTPLLDRYPSQLSGGQQQRLALARALARKADLLLLDEPLVNLDYKLREGLRSELREILSRQRTTVVYTTTDPQESLQFGGHTHVLHEGRLLQSGPALTVFRKPATLEVARACSDPPLNIVPLRSEAPDVAARLPAGAATFALRPYQLALTPRDVSWGRISGIVQLAELSGSETYVHFATADTYLIAQIAGVHRFELGQRCELYFAPEDLLCFDAAGTLLPAGKH